MYNFISPQEDSRWSSGEVHLESRYVKYYVEQCKVLDLYLILAYPDKTVTDSNRILSVRVSPWTWSPRSDTAGIISARRVARLCHHCHEIEYTLRLYYLNAICG